MQRSDSTAGLLSEQVEESSDAVEPTHTDLGLESYGVQGQREVGEGSVQVASEATPPSMQEDVQLDVEPGTTDGSSGVAVQPIQASHSSQEQPDGGEVALQADSGVVVQLTQAGSMIQSQNFQEQPDVAGGAIQPVGNAVVQPMQANLEHEPQNLQEQPSVEAREVHEVQPVQPVAFPDLPSPVSLQELEAVWDAHVRAGAFDDIIWPNDVHYDDEFDEILELVPVQGEASNQGEEAGNDRLVPQGPTNTLANGQVGSSHQEEEVGINDRIVPQAPPVDMDSFGSVDSAEPAGTNEPVDDEEDTSDQARAGQQQMQGAPTQQGTAGRRVRLQVRLCGAEWRSERNCETIASKQEAEFLFIEPADVLCKDATCSFARMMVKEEGDTVGLLSTEGSIARATKSDDTDGSQQTSQDIFGSSMWALISTHLFCSFYKLTRMVFTYV